MSTPTRRSLLTAAALLPLGLAGCAAKAVSNPATSSTLTTPRPEQSLKTTPTHPSSSSPTARSATPTPSTAPSSEPSPTQQSSAEVVRWADNGKVGHLFYHSLIVDGAVTFKLGKGKGQGYDDYMATIVEFKAQLEQLHRNGYILVHPQRLAAKGKDGVMRHTPLDLPKGKKPLVLSQDDLSYYEYMTGDGFPTKLLVDGQGRVRNEFTDAHGKTTIGSFDMVPLIDDFVREHPDFSYRGDKGTIALTGYNGVLGYRSSVWKYGNNAATKRAAAEAKVVADAMKEQGWKFSSHSWGHINMTESTLPLIRRDHQRWTTEVAPVVGETDMLIFAFGADISGMPTYSNDNAKFRYLHGQGIDYFFPIDTTTPSWSQLTGQAFRQARINVDGITLKKAYQGHKSVLNAYFDAKKTVDPTRPWA